MEYILETYNLTKTYDKKDAILNVNLHIEEGKIYGLIGRNGAEKTTIADCLLRTRITTSPVAYGVL